MPYLLIGVGVLAWALLIWKAPFPAVATAGDTEDDAAASGAFGSLRPRRLG